VSKRRARWALAALAALAVLAALALAGAGCSEQVSGSVETVHRAIGSDTVVLKTGEQVRLDGCEGPARGKPGWSDGRAELQRLIAGHKVRVERQGRDAQGRTLARVYLYDGREVSELMIARGLAKPRPGDAPAQSGPAPEPMIEPAGK